MALLHTGDRICASCGSINGHHWPGCTDGDSVEVISFTPASQRSKTAF